MVLPDNMDLTALIAEKCKNKGASWLQDFSKRSQAEAEEHLHDLMRKYSSFFAGLNKDELYENLDEMLYELSVAGSKILGIAMYKELNTCSLEKAFNAQRAIMANHKEQASNGNNFFQGLKDKAAESYSGSNNSTSRIAGVSPYASAHTIETVVPVTDFSSAADQPLKQYLLLQILLLAGIGFFGWLFKDSAQTGYGNVLYKLGAVFCAMALVMLILFKVYKRKVYKKNQESNFGEK